LPSWLLYSGSVAAWIGITLAIDSVLRHRMRAAVRSDAARTAAIMLGVLANIFAVLIAFVIVEGWNDFQNAQADVDREATAMTTIEENTRTLAPRDAADIRRALHAYAHSVIDDEWDVMARHGNGSVETTIELQRLFDEVRDGSPTSRADEAFFARSVESLDDLVSARQARVTAAGGSLPVPLYLLLSFGGFVVVALACTLDAEDRRSHLLIVCSIAAVIGLMLALVVSFDHPFTGGVSVNDESLVRFLETPPLP
jgi:hypothetical protein